MNRANRLIFLFLAFFLSLYPKNILAQTAITGNEVEQIREGFETGNPSVPSWNSFKNDLIYTGACYREDNSHVRKVFLFFSKRGDYGPISIQRKIGVLFPNDADSGDYDESHPETRLVPVISSKWAKFKPFEIDTSQMLVRFSVIADDRTNCTREMRFKNEFYFVKLTTIDELNRWCYFYKEIYRD